MADDYLDHETINGKMYPKIGLSYMYDSYEELPLCSLEIRGGCLSNHIFEQFWGFAKLAHSYYGDLDIDPSIPYPHLDDIPDLFYYNFPGNSGKFVMNNSYTSAMQLTSNNIKIIPIKQGDHRLQR